MVRSGSEFFMWGVSKLAIENNNYRVVSLSSSFTLSLLPSHCNSFLRLRLPSAMAAALPSHCFLKPHPSRSNSISNSTPPWRPPGLQSGVLPLLPTSQLHVRCSGETPVDKSGAGKSWVSPDWLTSVLRLGKGADVSGIPVADAKLEDVKDLLGGALFLPLFKWMKESGPVYRLAAGPRNFVIVGDPAVAKHVMKGYGGKYAKGLVSEVAEFLFGSGFAVAEGQLWTVFLLPFFEDFVSLHLVLLEPQFWKHPRHRASLR